MSKVTLLTGQEAADSLALSLRTLRTLVGRGELMPVRIGRAVRFDEDDLRRWVDERKAKPAGNQTEVACAK